MNIFKKIGIILSCSIIAFLGVFGVVASTSNINNQVRDLPVVERHNLVGSDIVLNETNYSDYLLTISGVDNGTTTITVGGEFNLTGYLLYFPMDGSQPYQFVNVNNVVFDMLQITSGNIAFMNDNLAYICSNENSFSDLNTDLSFQNTHFRFNNIGSEFTTVGGVEYTIEELFNSFNSYLKIYEPLVDQFLPTITTIVGDCVNWFVSIFTGLSDTFVLTDSNGVITGLSAWGQILFIGVAILLVSMALKWVISLVRGI